MNLCFRNRHFINEIPFCRSIIAFVAILGNTPFIHPEDVECIRLGVEPPDMATEKRPLLSTERLALATKISAACFAKRIGSSLMIIFLLKDISVTCSSVCLNKLHPDLL